MFARVNFLLLLLLSGDYQQFLLLRRRLLLFLLFTQFSSVSHRMYRHGDCDGNWKLLLLNIFVGDLITIEHWSLLICGRWKICRLWRWWWWRTRAALATHFDRTISCGVEPSFEFPRRRSVCDSFTCVISVYTRVQYDHRPYMLVQLKLHRWLMLRALFRCFCFLISGKSVFNYFFLWVSESVSVRLCNVLFTNEFDRTRLAQREWFLVLSGDWTSERGQMMNTRVCVWHKQVTLISA